MCGRLLWLSLLFLLVSSAGFSQDTSSSIQSQIQSKLLTLEIQLLSSQKKIDSLSSLLADTKKNDQNFIDDLKRQLEEQKAIYETLLSQSESLKSYLKRLETERTLLTIGVGAAVVVAVGTTIWALVEHFSK